MKKLFGYSQTLNEMFLGILAFGAVIWIAGIWFVKDRLLFSSGLWLGILIACMAVWHMWKGLDVGLDLDNATKYITRQNMIRYGLIVISYSLICVWEMGNPVAAFIGIMGIKAGAYLQPLTHKLFSKRKRR